jgi:cathepsin L
MCGSCWAFGSTESIESHVALSNNGTLIELSPQNLVSCDPNPKHCGGTGGCGGSIAELAFDYVQANGIASEKDYPYTSGHTSSDGQCKNVTASARVGGYVKLKENNYTVRPHTEWLWILLPHSHGVP